MPYNKALMAMNMTIKNRISPTSTCLSIAVSISLLTHYSEAFSNQSVLLDKVVVTSTKEQRYKSELAESIGVLTRQEIENVSPSHPSEILNRTAGVYINNLGGEGHMTAIRQPITTSGVYLFLEDGVPTRPTGFFNHNGLYEINIPQSKRLEVTKGPGSALYGSDAIGGVINSISADIPDTPTAKIDSEIGSDQWRRLLLSAGQAINDSTGVSASINKTNNKGFRDDADYDRTSINTRIDHAFSDELNNKTTLSYTQVNQSGVSGLNYDDYKNNVEKNKFKGDIGSREIAAVRISSEFNYDLSEQSLLTVTPFYRNNDSSMMPSWMVTYDPNYRQTTFQSFGLITKYRHTLSNNSQIITGIDVDHTPSETQEFDVTVTPPINDIYSDYTKTGHLNYDYDADQTSISPYVQIEHQINKSIRLHTGLRYDHFSVKYTDNLSTVADSSHLRPESQSIKYDHLSPKLGAVLKLNAFHDMYANYRHAFRAPSVGTLFRSGSSTGTTELKPVKSDSYEIGFRGITPVDLSYEVAIYYMEKTDDIVSIINSDSTRQSVNAGETIHKGIEVSLQGGLSESFSFQSSLSISEQTYGDFSYIYFCFSCSPKNQVINFNGNKVGKAPKTLGNVSLRFEPNYLYGFMAEVEVEHVGDYYVDETNTDEYSGHNLLNLRSRYKLNETIELYGRIQNIEDKRYSTYTSLQVGSSDVDYRPGAPLSVYAGIRAHF
ncbi:MAG: iron complex outermembrane receptor protein [Psychrobacter glaciei]|jgi:iron complex outermembrane receptor protein